MDEDIDIEEHDLLDNPIIKSIFPDISVIKKEIECYYNAGKPNIFILKVLTQSLNLDDLVLLIAFNNFECREDE